MRLCLELAEKGFGSVSPNPMVGCVIVNDGEIIGSGYHKVYGGPHAEVEAVRSVKNKSELKGATVYVSLEPCAHYGKTPPCASMLIEEKVGRVFIGSKDPNPLVAGKGIAMLEAAGIETGCGILENECMELNRRFFTYQLHKRPYVILKWAETADGFMGGNGIKQISGQDATALLHRWRSEEDAFMVGTNTLLMDNPRLNTRHWEGKDPVRVCIDFNLRSRGLDLNIFQPGQKTIVLNGLKHELIGQTEYVKINSSSPEDMLLALYERQIQSVVIEGGAQLLNSFIQAGLYDEVRRFVSTDMRANTGIKAPVLHLKPTQTIPLSQDYLLIYRK